MFAVKTKLTLVKNTSITQNNFLSLSHKKHHLLVLYLSSSFHWGGNKFIKAFIITRAGRATAEIMSGGKFILRNMKS